MIFNSLCVTTGSIFLIYEAYCSNIDDVYFLRKKGASVINPFSPIHRATLTWKNPQSLLISSIPTTVKAIYFYFKVPIS